MTLEHLSKVLNSLLTDEIQCLIAGGLAVIAHGHTRVTHNLNIVIALDPESTNRTMETLTKLGFAPRLPVSAQEFCDQSIRQRWIHEKDLQVFSMINEGLVGFIIDIFQKSLLISKRNTEEPPSLNCQASMEHYLLPVKRPYSK